MADGENQEVNSSGGGKGLIIVLIGLVLILILAVAGGAYFLYSQGVLTPKDGETTSQEEKIVKGEAGDSSETYKAEVNDLVLNITNAKGREKLMKLSFSLKSVEPTIAALVEKYNAEIGDIVIRQISARSSEELLTVGGKALLKEELLEEINLVMNEMTANNEDVKTNNIKNILFTAFVIK